MFLPGANVKLTITVRKQCCDETCVLSEGKCAAAQQVLDLCRSVPGTRVWKKQMPAAEASQGRRVASGIHAYKSGEKVTHHHCELINEAPMDMAMCIFGKL